MTRPTLLDAMVGCAERHLMDVGRGWILDVPAGRGNNRHALLSKLGGKRYIGIDEDVAGADYVSHLALDAAPETWNGRFHFAYVHRLLGASEDVHLAMQSLKRLLAPHGIIGCVTLEERRHVGEWMALFKEHGLQSAYAVIEEHDGVPEGHLVLVHEEWPLQP